MPAQVADWADVKATAISTGSLKDAARLHGIEHNAVKQRAKREGWPVGRRVHLIAAEAKAAAAVQIVRAAPVTRPVTSVTSAAEAALVRNAEHSKRTREAGLEYSALTTEAAAKQARTKPLLALERAPLVKAALQGAALAGDWQQQASAGSTLNLLSSISVTVEHKD